MFFYCIVGFGLVCWYIYRYFYQYGYYVFDKPNNKIVTGVSSLGNLEQIGMVKISKRAPYFVKFEFEPNKGPMVAGFFIRTYIVTILLFRQDAEECKSIITDYLHPNSDA